MVSKIAISCEGRSLRDRLSSHFGRAGYFLIVDPESTAFEVLDNAACQAREGGAGVSTADAVASTGARVVLTGRAGPTAVRVLDAAGIEVIQGLEGPTAADALESYRAGRR